MTSSVPAQVGKLLGTELPTRLVRVTSGFNEALYSAANEPSLGLYRIQEHVMVAVPRLVEQQRSLQETCQQVEGASYDLEYDTQALKSARNITQFTSVRNRLEGDVVKYSSENLISLSHLFPSPFLPPSHTLSLSLSLSLSQFAKGH